MVKEYYNNNGGCMDNLKKQYFNLTDEEKTALLIYKSSLGKLMNDIDNNPDYKKYYDRFVNIFKDHIHDMIRLTVFNQIDFTSLESFIESVKQVKTIVDDVSTKLTTDKDFILYRLISNDEEIKDISKGNIVSTSLDPAEVFKYGRKEDENGFATALFGKNIAVYEIHLPKSSHVCYVPGRLNYVGGRLYFSSKIDEEEIIINKDVYELEETSRVVDIDEDHDTSFTYVTCIAHEIKKTRNI